MFTLDIRTVVFSNVITDLVSTLVVVFLWYQNRQRVKGTTFWVISFVFQTIGLILIIFRNNLPPWISIDLSNILIIAGAILGLIGLERFTGQRSRQIINILLLTAFAAIHTWFTYVKPDLAIRTLNTSVAMLIVCTRCAWLVLVKVPEYFRKITIGVGLVFVAFSLVSMARVVEYFVTAHTYNDFFQTDAFGALTLISYQMLFILLAYSLTLMFNKHLLSSLSTQEEKYSKAFQSSSYAITFTRLSDGTIFEVNNGFLKITGYKYEDVVGTSTLDIHFWASVGDRNEVVGDLLDHKTVNEKEFQFRKKSGELFFGLISCEIVTINNEECLISSIHDISISKKNEIALRESEKHHRSLFENMLNGYSYCKMQFDEDRRPVDFTYLAVNNAFESQTGLKDVIGRKASDVIPGITKTDRNLIELYGRVASGGKPEHFEMYVEALQMWFWISVYSPHKDHFVAVFDVISERKRIENNLRESEEKFRNLFENSPVGKSITGIDGTIEVNKSFSEILGYTETELKSKNFKEITHPDDLVMSNGIIESLLEGKSAQIRFEKRYISRSGEIVYADVSTYLQRGKDGEPQYFITTVNDITKRKLFEKALKESEERYRSTLDNMLEGSQLIGFDWRYLYVNHAAEKHNRRPKEELLGKRYMEVWPGIEETEVFAIIKRCLEMRTPHIMINSFVFPDGTKGWFDLSIQPVPEGVFILSTDITARIQAENNENLEKEVLEQLNRHTDSEVMIGSIIRLIKDKTGFEAIGIRLKEGDDFPYYSTLGFPEEFVKAERNLCTYDRSGKVLLDKSGDPLLDCMCGNILCGRVDHSKTFFTSEGSFVSGNTTQLLATTTAADRLARTRNRCNSSGYESVALIPIRSGNQIIGLLQLNDHRKNIFTEDIIPFFEGIGSSIGLALNRNNAEKEIKKLNEELELRVFHRTAQLEEANKELEAFSYSVSHDLRAPLRAIHSFTSILREDYGNVLDEEGLRIAGIVESSSIHMGELIDDLLAFSRVGRLELRYTRIDLATLLQTVYSDLTTPAERERIHLTVGKLPAVYGDASTIRQVAINLLSNAIKYTSRLDMAEISVGFQRINSEVVYYIKDNGVGFDMKYVSKLFGVFQRLHSFKEFEGNGVGLAIIQRIILRHGGRVWAEGEIDNGATFYFVLPSKKSAVNELKKT